MKSVDKYHLEDEAAELPELMYEATKKLPKLYESKRMLAQQLTELETDLFIKIKKRPKKYFGDLDKPPTDTAIHKMVASQEKVKELNKKIIKAEALFLKQQNKVKVIDTRKSSIKYMQELYMAEYYSINKVSDDDANTSEFRTAKRKLKNKNKKKRSKL